MTELSLRRRLAFGIAGITMNLPDQVMMQWLLVRYLPPDAAPLVPRWVFGFIVLLCRIAEAMENPIIGHISDETRTRWGRRMPFLRLGILPFVLVFFLLFSPPFSGTTWLNAIWAFVMLNLYLFGYAVIITPYLALLPEITSDLKERVDLATYQSVFILVGTFIFAGMGMVLENWGWTVLAGLTAVIAFVSFMPVCTLVREKEHPPRSAHEPLHLFQSVRMALGVQPFRCMLASTALFWFGLNGIIVLTPLWVVGYLGRDEGVVSQVLGVFIMVDLVFFFVINALAHRVGKYVLMQMTYLTGGIVITMFALIGHLPFGNEYVQTLFVVALFGIPAAGFTVLPFAVLSDIVDYDETITGRRREALYVGVMGMGQKITIGLSVLSFTFVPYFFNHGTQVLREGGGLRFTGQYTREAGADEPASAVSDKANHREPATARVIPDPPGVPATWTLTGPNGYKYDGLGEEVVPNLTPGTYAVTWHTVSGWIQPESPRLPTPAGLKTMALLCGLFCIGGFLAFSRYPIREKDGKAYLVGQN